MRDEYIRRAQTDPRLFQRMEQLSETLSEATQHDIRIRVIGHNPPVFTVIVDGSQVDPWMPWEQTIMFLQGLITGVGFDDTKAYSEGIAAATAQVQDALNRALSQDRDADTSVDSSAP